MGTTRETRRLAGIVPVSYSPGLNKEASDLSATLATGCNRLTDLLQLQAPESQAMLLSEEDWPGAPREAENPYPFGLPYFTRSADIPTLVFPAKLSEVLRPRTEISLALTVWHELAHAFFLSREVVKTPLWLGEFVPQAASAAVALREGLSPEDHLSKAETPGFTVREFTLPAPARDQMRFQSLLLSFGVAAVREFGDGFLSRLIRSLWEESGATEESRAQELFAASLGEGGREWLSGREDF